MAETFIEEIYSKSELIMNTKIAYLLSIRNQTALLKYHWERLRSQIPSFCDEVKRIDPVLGDKIFNTYLELCDNSLRGNTVKTTDMLEEVIHLLYNAMVLFAGIDVEEGAYRLFSSKSGYLSIENMQSKRLLCSAIDPMWEAYEKAQVLINHRIKAFCTFGCGLGYLAYQMYAQTNENIDIYVFDVDSTMVDYAIHYGVLGWIPENRIHIIINSDPNDLLKESSELLDGFSIENVFNFEKEVIDKLSPEGREILVRLMIQASSQRNLSGIGERNFLKNISANTRNISELRKQSHNKEWIVVGGGPSIDYNVEYIKESRGKKTIVAATTIYKRLIREGIEPDYIVALDPLDRIWKHVDGEERADIPIIIADSATSEFTQKYPGTKYIVPTGDNLISKEFCNYAGIETWVVEGTVTCLCIKVALYLGAEKIELVGVDLSYPDNQTHASGTLDYKEIDVSGKKKIRAVDGGFVYSDETFMEYIDSIEGIISNNPNVSFYNLSKKGAYIAGCKPLTYSIQE